MALLLAVAMQPVAAFAQQSPRELEEELGRYYDTHTEDEFLAYVEGRMQEQADMFLMGLPAEDSDATFELYAPSPHWKELWSTLYRYIALECSLIDKPVQIVTPQEGFMHCMRIRTQICGLQARDSVIIALGTSAALFAGCARAVRGFRHLMVACAAASLVALGGQLALANSRQQVCLLEATLRCHQGREE